LRSTGSRSVAEAREELAVFAGAIRVSEAGAGADPVCAVAFALESDGIDERRTGLDRR
jgi:hypothetical protein